ncbi:MAG: hypothetical protein RL266_1947 [Bacteroidota bacterium]
MQGIQIRKNGIDPCQSRLHAYIRLTMKRPLFLFLLTISNPLFAQDPQIQQMLSDVSLDSLIYYSSAISGEFPVTVDGNAVTIASRNKNNPGNALAARYIKERLESFGLSTSLQTFGATGENVVATQPGLVYPNQKVILCGHYDSMPTGGLSPAADDDGSGTAAVIEAARILSQYHFAYTLVYAVWDEEEYGLVGANAYASAAENNGDSIIAVINMDAIAWDGDGDKLARVHVRPIANSVNLGTVAVNMISTYGIDLNIETNNPGATYSDHAAFWNHDFSAILLIEDFDNDGNPHYHTTTDRVEYFDTTYFGAIAKWAFATTATMAVPVDPSVSVADQPSAELRIYPNPSKGIMAVSLTEHTGQWVDWRVVDVSGRSVLQNRSRLPFFFDVAPLKTGIYWLDMKGMDADIDLSQIIIRN